ncbi:MAG: type II secretion system protein [Verrucomicrobiota bacterium]
MKISRLTSHRSYSFLRESGFTLIELLVVITILGILMGMAVGGTSAIKEQSKMTQAKNDCMGMVIAIKAFYADYSRYPVPAAKQDDVPYEAGESNKPVLDIITAKNDEINPRKVSYYEPKARKTDSEGHSSGGGLDNNTGDMYDPWGTTFGIIVDGDYDSNLTYAGAGMKDLKETEKAVVGGVGVYSLGNPKKTERKPVLSWQ